MDADDLLHGLPEGRRAASAVPRVAALGDGPRVGERLLARPGERDDRVGAEADIGGLAVQAYPLPQDLEKPPVEAGFTRRLRAVSAASIAVRPGTLTVLTKVAESRLGRFIGVGAITSVIIFMGSMRAPARDVKEQKTHIYQNVK